MKRTTWETQRVSACVTVTIGLAALLVVVGGCPDVIPPGSNDNTVANDNTGANDNAGDNDNTGENDNTGDNDNTGGNDNSGANPNARFAGADTCAQCHANKHADWSETAHATALDALAEIGQDTNAECLACHTVGFGEQDGYVDVASTPQLVGVQCENCHGAAGDHARNPADENVRPRIDMSAAVCGACHAGAHHPTFEEWQLSKHASALAGLRTSSHAQDSCLECHSQDYREAVEEPEEGVEPPTLDSAQLSIECATCHDPHGGVPQDKQLRKPIAALCGECHTQEEALLGDTPHHPQFEMVSGTGAFDADAQPLTQTGPHTSLVTGEGGQACAQCHVVRHDVEDPNEGNPNVTGHTFNPFDPEITEHQADQYTGCLLCHDESTADEHRTRVQAEIAGRLADLAPAFDAESDQYIDPEPLEPADQDRLAAAKFNFQFVGADGSSGVHNAYYARALLDAADAVVADLRAP